MAVITKFTESDMRQTQNNLRTLIILIIVLISSCDKEENSSIEYPITGLYGDNILQKEKIEFTNRENSFQSKIPGGKNVKIIITGKTVSNDGLIPSGIWYYDPTTSSNWSVTNFDETTNTQTFSSTNGGQTSDVKMMFDNGTFEIDYYENNSLTPTMSKTITVTY